MRLLALLMASQLLAGCAQLASLLQGNNDADNAASYIVQVCALPEGQRAAALDAMNHTIAPRTITLNCP